jgi:DNA polymerase-1
MRTVVFDIETDGLLKEVTVMHILSAVCVETGERFRAERDDPSWKPYLSGVDIVVGHNIINYDLCVLKKLFDFDLPASVEIRDTLIMSQVLDYNRFGRQGHSMKVWGEHLGFPKMEFSDWSTLTPEMIAYCDNDVDLNVKIYKILRQEVRDMVKKGTKIVEYLNAEHYAGRWQARAQLEGWPFDVEGAKVLEATLRTEVDAAIAALEPKLGTKTVATDKCKGEVPFKLPKFIKSGAYDSHTARWFNIDPWEGFEDDNRLVVGPYSRVEFKELSLTSVEDVKLFLYRNGWVPTEWNINKETKEKTSPKITLDSIEFLGGDAQIYSNFLTTKSRHSIVKTWLENVDDNGNLHGDSMLIGTPSMRTRHSIIVNVPTANSKWGAEMRSLFTCRPGWTLIGADSAGNQARGLAHYLADESYIDTLLNGDIHQYNADKLTEVVNSLSYNLSTLKKQQADDMRRKFEKGFKHAVEKGDEKEEHHYIELLQRLDAEGWFVERGRAKRVLYSFLFGASGGKIWSYIFDIQDPTKGNKLKTGFTNAVPGFAVLVKRLNDIYWKTSQTGSGYIPSIAGNRVYVDSSHKLLVYLLQSLEKITCTAALMLTVQRLEAAGIEYSPKIMYHDEIDFEVKVEDADNAAAIAKQAFADGPKLYGVEIMDGDAKVGRNWLEIH